MVTDDEEAPEGILDTTPLLGNARTVYASNPVNPPVTRVYYASRGGNGLTWIQLVGVFILGIVFGIALWPVLFVLISHRYAKELPTNLPLHLRNTTLRRNGDFTSTDSVAAAAKNFQQASPVRFEDIAGMTEAKAELSEFVQYLRNPEPYKRLGARLPKGILLMGPPGSGKTMLANAVATEAGIPYLYISGSEFVEIFVGQGARRVRHLFQVARSIAPCILFIDELDAVGGRRLAGMGSGGQREHDQTLNQLLVELDGFNASSGIMVLAATNRIDALDPALLRPGRFDRIVRVGLPDITGRAAILRMYLSSIPFNESDDVVQSLARMTPGFSGADLENLVNEAALLAARMGKTRVTEKDLYEARDKVSMGPERRSLVIPEAQRRITAYHEAGHAIVAYYLQPETDPIHKVTIISRGNALGLVEQIPPEDRFGQARAQLEARLAVSMGGRVAEQIVFGKDRVSNGASSDILMATAIAYKMVSEWGMSDKVGPLNYKLHYGNYPEGGMEVSGKTTNLIESEVRNLVLAAQRNAEDLVRRHRMELDVLANALLEKETLSGEEVTQILSLKEKENLLPSTLLSFFKGKRYMSSSYEQPDNASSEPSVNASEENLEIQFYANGTAVSEDFGRNATKTEDSKTTKKNPETVSTHGIDAMTASSSRKKLAHPIIQLLRKVLRLGISLGLR